MCKANHLPTYQELLSAYFCVQQENEKLKAEIGRLWQRLSAVWRLSDDEKSQEQIVTMTTPQLSVEERVTLFRSLFKGREDVFARRWYSKATHKSGYQPVCLNEWRNSVCDKRKCSGCRKTIYKQREEAMGNANARTTRRKLFSDTQSLTRANMLYVHSVDLSAKVANHLKRIASFRNPEFYV